MPAHILDGAAIAATVRAEVAAGVAELRAATDAVPGLVTVMGGDDPASRRYARSIGRNAERVGMRHQVVTLSPRLTDAGFGRVIRRLNRDKSVHGVIVMQPLPPGLSARTVAETLDPAKDVEGITTVNAGRLVLREPSLVPTTPLGGMELVRRYHLDVRGLQATVVGRSTILGRPLAVMLLNESATVTVCHTGTGQERLEEACRRADLLCAATGRPGLIRGDMVKPGAIVLDFGTTPGPDGKLVGDVDVAAAHEVAAWLATGPGGTGPMTTAMLLSNTLAAARMQVGRR